MFVRNPVAVVPTHAAAADRKSMSIGRGYRQQVIEIASGVLTDRPVMQALATSGVVAPGPRVHHNGSS
jgi:hypothetical protein